MLFRYINASALVPYRAGARPPKTRPTLYDVLIERLYLEGVQVYLS